MTAPDGQQAAPGDEPATGDGPGMGGAPTAGPEPTAGDGPGLGGGQPAGDGAGGGSASSAGSAADYAPGPDQAQLATVVGLSLMMGWTMAVLYGGLPGDPAGSQPGEPEPVQVAQAAEAAELAEAAAPEAAAGEATAAEAADQVPSPVVTGPPVPVAEVAPAAESEHLATLHELAPQQRRTVELVRLQTLLRDLAASTPAASQAVGASLPATVWAAAVPLAALRAKLVPLNLAILTALTGFGTEAELAYELGRSLRDTANPPGAAGHRRAGLKQQLDRGRVAQLQEWLAVLAEHLPKHAAAVVGISLGRWCEFADATNGGSIKVTSGRRGNGTDQTCRLLLKQGDVWLMLLTGTDTTARLLTPEGYVAAGEAAISRSARIAKSVLRKYWPALAVLLAALGAMLYLAIEFTRGAATAWTSIASISGTLGVSAVGTSSVITRLGEEATLPVLAPAEEDAMAWAITTLPQQALSSRQARRLRKAGVPPSAGLGRR